MAVDSFELRLLPRLLGLVGADTTDLAAAILEIPAADYTDADRWEREREVLFRGTPLLIAFGAQLPELWSYRTLEIAGIPVLVVRGADARVRAFANICRHRGVQVADGCGSARRFTCPFHGWTYDTEGRLAGIPKRDGFAGMDPSGKGLVALPTVERHGLVFAVMRPDAELDVDAFLGPELGRQLAMFDFSNWVPVFDTHVHRVGANWKIVVDTYRENYHIDHLHRETLAGVVHGSTLAVDSFGPHTRNASALRSIDGLGAVPVDEWEAFDHYAVQYGIFPNITLAVTKVRMEFWQILPGGAVDETLVLHAGLTPPWAPELSAAEQARLANVIEWTCTTVVDGEDFRIAERMMAGLRSGAVDRVVIGRNELAVQTFHRACADAVAGVAAS